MESYLSRVPPPPRAINVQHFTEARASEFEALYSLISNRANNDFRSHRSMRRRTRSYDNRHTNKHRKRQKVGRVGEESTSDPKKDQAKTSRRIRRRLELKRNPASGFCVTGDGTKRLRTHVWHAKRYLMTKLWGFSLPLHLQGRGRGSRALLAWARQGVVIHDASYYCTIQMNGLEDALLSVLSKVLSPFPTDDRSSMLCGDAHGTAILHHADGTFRVIAPVICMWRPCCRSSFTCADECNANIRDMQSTTEAHSQSRQIWIWLHPSSFEEGYALLDIVCKKQKEDTGLSVSCISLNGYLGKLEVMGPKAFQLLQKTIFSTQCTSEDYLPSNMDKDVNYESKSPKSFISEDELCSHAIVSTVVSDPRLFQQPSSEKEQSEMLNHCNELWDAIDGLNPPVEEEVINSERHTNRLKYFCLNSGASVTNVTNNHLRLCPILLLKNYKQNDKLKRWSIICPLSWVKVFWISFVTSRAKGIGLVERHWISHDAGLPYFPDDFPDTVAYLKFMENKAILSEEKLERRPCNLRPSRIPILPPWDVILFTSNEVLGPGDTWNMSSDGNCTDNLYPHSLEKFVVRQADKLALHISKNVSASFPGELCFARVILRPYKEGSFDEGAVVCAPCVNDITLWTSRVEDVDNQLQIPQASVDLYFVENFQRKWVLQIPNDSIEREFFRWPIGFVTTGFVRGSKKQVAQGFCDVVLLAELRKEQERAMPRRRGRQEIYVLVRNLRSTAYRLALAMVILEQHEEDIEFM